MMPRMGIEPGTPRPKVRCATDCTSPLLSKIVYATDKMVNVIAILQMGKECATIPSSRANPVADASQTD